MPTVDLSVAHLREATTLLLDALERRFGPELHKIDDINWNVPLQDAVEVNRNPELDMGSVADDAESVRKFAFELNEKT